MGDKKAGGIFDATRLHKIFYFSSKLPSATAFTEEAYSDGVIPVILLNCLEK